jgi:hypothetical protein
LPDHPPGRHEWRRRHGQAFRIHRQPRVAADGREEIAKATNSLFKIGFYLLNIGFALFILKIYDALTGMQSTIEALSSKIGGFSIYLGIMLFFNIYLFFRGKKAAKRKHDEYVSAEKA